MRLMLMILCYSSIVSFGSCFCFFASSLVILCDGLPVDFSDVDGFTSGTRAGGSASAVLRFSIPARRS
jgi:hypothetical protein